MNIVKNQFACLCFILLSFNGSTHTLTKTKVNQITSSSLNESTRVTYLGNEALFISSGKQKILFDPFFTHDFGIYQLVPEKLQNNILKGEAPFNNITDIFISHAHRDHFVVNMLANYLARFSSVNLYGSTQAIEQVQKFSVENKLAIDSKRLIEVALDFGSKPFNLTKSSLEVNAIRIPHAGWPSRANVENLVFSVKFHSGDTVMHMGDADPDFNHYVPYIEYFEKQSIDVNFPPYWFFMSLQGRDILTNMIKAKKNVGIHVPKTPPKELTKQTNSYFLTPESIHIIE